MWQKPNKYKHFCTVEGTTRIERTCPADGTYYIMIKGYGSSTGTFTLTASSSSGGTGGPADPCSASGSAMAEPAASISFQPDGGTQDDQTCTWMINCPQPGTMPTITFTDFDTESNFDFVRVYDGPTPNGRQMGEMSGSLADLPSTTMTSSSTAMTVQFTH